MKRRWVYVLIAVLLALTLACAGSNDNDDPPPTRDSGSGSTPKPPPATDTPRPTPTPLPPTSTPRSAAPPPEDNASLTLQNYSGGTACYVRISPSDSDNWGNDWLGGDEVLPTDSNRVFDLAPGTYNLRVEDCDWEVLYEEMSIAVNGDVTVTMGGLGSAPPSGSTVTLINQLDTTICYVFISPSSSDQWGDDQLGESEVLTPGDRRDFSFPDGTYDIAALDCDENVVMERYGFILDGVIALTAGDVTEPPAETVSVYFVADRYTVRPGECATISWSVENAATVLYNGQAVGVDGSRLECPSSTTLYPLEVEDLNGSWSQYQVEIRVETGY